MCKTLALVALGLFFLAGSAHAITTDGISNVTPNGNGQSSDAKPKIGFLQGSFHTIKINSDENLSSSSEVVVPETDSSSIVKLALPLFAVALIGGAYFFRRKGGFPVE